MSLGYWLGGDPADDSHLPDWVFDYEVCEVCERADTRIQDYNFSEYGIDVCDCVECESCGELKEFEDFCNVAEICDSCFDIEDEKYQKERMEKTLARANERI